MHQTHKEERLIATRDYQDLDGSVLGRRRRRRRIVRPFPVDPKNSVGHERVHGYLDAVRITR
jgi:hypothetical protein